MAFTIFLIVLVVVAVVSSASAWYARCRSPDATGPRPASPRPVDPSATSAAIGEGESHGEHVEVALTMSLLAGHLSADDYRRNMAIVAAQDAPHRPLAAPPDR